MWRVLTCWQALQAQFGADFKRRRAFAAKVRDTLKDVLTVYREAQVEPQDQGLLLRTSRPPITRRNPVVAG